MFYQTTLDFHLASYSEYVYAFYTELRAEGIIFLWRKCFLHCPVGYAVYIHKVALWYHFLIYQTNTAQDCSPWTSQLIDLACPMISLFWMDWANAVAQIGVHGGVTKGVLSLFKPTPRRCTCNGHSHRTSPYQVNIVSFSRQIIQIPSCYLPLFVR